MSYVLIENLLSINLFEEFEVQRLVLALMGAIVLLEKTNIQKIKEKY